MCNKSCLEFGNSHLTLKEVKNKKVIEVGAININGSLKKGVMAHSPVSYLGVDIISGQGVDELCDINDLVDRYKKESFDVVICTEVFEHVRNWRNAVSNIKNILKPNGVLILTTRSEGFPYHGFPFDFWRYEKDDISAIFGDLSIEVNKSDPSAPGIFLKAHKPIIFNELFFEKHMLYSVVNCKKCQYIGEMEIYIFRVKYFIRLLIKKALSSIRKYF